MSKTVNKVLLLGNVGKDPEIASTNGGTLVAKLSLATSERFKDKQGEWQERTEWHNLVAYARSAEILRDYVRKGSKLYVQGRLTTRSWDDRESGRKMYRTEIVVGDISLISRGDGSGTGKSRAEEHAPQNPETGGNSNDFDGLGISAQDIPF
ncbi:MAG TPA: single-stranded DNA-binding protein [Acidobacteriaceae bacterium]|nr:single-stranded DNA-binding protein [Acidobacteriaceae bacterium]